MLHNKDNSRTVCTQASQPTFARKGVDRSHHCISPEKWTWLLCSV